MAEPKAEGLGHSKQQGDLMKKKVRYQIWTRSDEGELLEPAFDEEDFDDKTIRDGAFTSLKAARQHLASIKDDAYGDDYVILRVTYEQLP